MFQWAARFPLLGIELGHGRPDAALEQARAMLDPSQQPLPDELRELLRQADHPCGGESLTRALELARDGGYA